MAVSLCDPMSQYSAVDGYPADWHLRLGGSRVDDDRTFFID
jgi:hypothetical protein